MSATTSKILNENNKNLTSIKPTKQKKEIETLEKFFPKKNTKK